jgi:hypothetical protein
LNELVAFVKQPSIFKENITSNNGFTLISIEKKLLPFAEITDKAIIPQNYFQVP